MGSISKSFLLFLVLVLAISSPITIKKKLHLNRNVGIAVFLIIVLIVSVGATIYYMQTVVPEFSMSLSSSDGTVIQGSSIETSVFIFNFSGRPENVSLSGNAGSSGIQCNFNPSTGANSFTSNLTINVPSSTPTNNYLVNVTATNGEVTHEASYNISVLSAKVLVTGNITWGPTLSFSYNISSIQFSDTSTGASYSVPASTDYTSTDYNEAAFSVSLDNEHTYNVTYYYDVIIWINYPIVVSSGESSLGFVTVYAPVGNTTETQSFSATATPL